MFLSFPLCIKFILARCNNIEHDCLDMADSNSDDPILMFWKCYLYRKKGLVFRVIG